MNSRQQHSKPLNAALWTAQGLLAAALVAGGLMKLLAPDSLPFPWAKEQPTLVWVTGLVDLLGGLGVLLPGLLGKWPRLCALAAVGIMALMAAAMAFHVSRGEAGDIGFNVFVLLLAAFVAWGRR